VKPIVMSETFNSHSNETNAVNSEAQQQLDSFWPREMDKIRNLNHVIILPLYIHFYYYLILIYFIFYLFFFFIKNYFIFIFKLFFIQ
jgi:hypothetical protein